MEGEDNVMRISALVFVITLLAGSVAAYAAEEADVLRKQSPYSADETIERFEAAVRERGMMVFPRIDHSEAARSVGLTMPTTVVIPFGNPRFGTPRMIEVPLSAVEFPPKALVYEDADGQVWMAYQSANFLFNNVSARHGLSSSEEDVENLRRVLDSLSDAAVEAP